jgi:hypothetical protein
VNLVNGAVGCHLLLLRVRVLGRLIRGGCHVRRRASVGPLSPGHVPEDVDVTHRADPTARSWVVLPRL